MAKRNDQPKVYLATFPNGKRYVGITTATLAVRKSEHYSKAKNGSQYAIHNALNKYGQNVKWEILRECNSYQEAKELEVYFIKTLETIAPNGYNLTVGGDGSKGHRLSESQRQKMSEAHLGYKMPKSQKEKIGAANKGVRKIYAKQIKRIDTVTGDVKIYSSFQDINSEGIFDKACVYKCAAGQRKQHKGFFWEMVK